VRAGHPSPHERLLHLVFLVAVAYGIVILGVRFVAPFPRSASSARTVRVTVVSVASRHAPRHPVVLAQVDARGAGRVPRALAAEKALPSGGAPSRGRRRATAAVNRLPYEGSGPRHGRSRRGAKTALLTARRGPYPAPSSLRGAQGSGLRLTVAHLVAPETTDLPPVRSSGQPERPAGAGRSRGWPAVSARAARYALYLARWKTRVEGVGDRLLSAEPAGPLRGELRLEVKLARNGTVVGVALLRPSRRPELNDLALRILHRAEPFAPIPPGVLGRHRYLRFVYLWRFAGGKNDVGG
jgi:protein TonB